MFVNYSSIFCKTSIYNYIYIYIYSHYHGSVLNYPHKSMVSLSLCEGHGIRGFIRAFGKQIWIYPAKYAFSDIKATNNDENDSDVYHISDKHIIYLRANSYPVINDLMRTRRRLALYNNGDNVVEAYILADKSLVDYWKGRAGNNWYSELTLFLSDMINAVDSYFKNTEWGPDIGLISIKLVELDIVESFSGIYSEISNWQYYRDTTYLNKFIPWFNTNKNPETFDYAMIYAASKYLSDGFMWGYSFKSAICNNNLKAGQMSNTAEGLMNIHDQSALYAHELGHNLGAPHDNDGECNGYYIDPAADIMLSDIGENAYSSCSIAYIQKAFQEKNGYPCLARRNNQLLINGNQVTPFPTPASKEEIFYDTFENLNWWTASSNSHVRLYTDTSCMKGTKTGNYDCVRIHGKTGEQCYIIRSVRNTYSSYTLVLDIITRDLKHDKDEYCKISYSFNYNDWIQLGLYKGVSDDWIVKNQEQEFSFFNNGGSNNEDTLYIKLEAVGTDAGNNWDYCIYDNVYLYGDTGTLSPTAPTSPTTATPTFAITQQPTTSKPTTPSTPSPTTTTTSSNNNNNYYGPIDGSGQKIFFDSFENLNLWTKSSSAAADLCTCGKCIPSPESGKYDCVIVNGKHDEERYITRSVSNIYSSYTIQLDVITWALDVGENEYCKISYSFDNNNWIQLGLYRGIDNGFWTPYKEQQFKFTNTDSNKNTLYIKLEAVGYHPVDPYDHCIYDNVYLYGHQSGSATTVSPTTTTTTSSTTSAPTTTTTTTTTASPTATTTTTTATPTTTTTTTTTTTASPTTTTTTLAPTTTTTTSSTTATPTTTTTTTTTITASPTTTTTTSNNTESSSTTTSAPTITTSGNTESSASSSTTTTFAITELNASTTTTTTTTTTINTVSSTSASTNFQIFFVPLVIHFTMIIV